MREEIALMDISFLTVPGVPPPPPSAAYSHAVRAGDFLFVTGQLGVDPKTNALVAGGAAEQAKQIMRNLETVLRGAGTTLERTVMARIYLINFAADYPAVNEVYRSCFGKAGYPARTTVGVTNLALGAMVEIDLIVAL
jgi:2-iminobutanoate/2-iminopropanoate deaminase